MSWFVDLINGIRSTLGINWQEDLLRDIQRELERRRPMALAVHSQKQAEFGEREAERLAKEIPGADDQNLTFCIVPRKDCSLGQPLAWDSRRDRLIISVFNFANLLCSRLCSYVSYEPITSVGRIFREVQGVDQSLIVGQMRRNYFFVIDILPPRYDKAYLYLIVREEGHSLSLWKSKEKGYRIHLDPKEGGFLTALKKLHRYEESMMIFVTIEAMFSMFNVLSEEHEIYRMGEEELQDVLNTLEENGIRPVGFREVTEAV